MIKNGNLDVFMEEKTNDLGGKDKVVYDFKNGEKVATSKTTFNPNGTSYTENLKTGSVSIKNVDGTYCWFDKDGKVVAKLTSDGSSNTYFTEYANGKNQNVLQ
ncbi:MAG: hypothetical protein IJY61_08950 [Candidatus Gastranaerophilales bacterium]|nr:hypothetical protein [Candidatus Gastranaerophilales bacterium]